MVCKTARLALSKQPAVCDSNLNHVHCVVLCCSRLSRLNPVMCAQPLVRLSAGVNCYFCCMLDVGVLSQNIDVCVCIVLVL
jgi:hypothetical protein